MASAKELLRGCLARAHAFYALNQSPSFEAFRPTLGGHSTAAAPVSTGVLGNMRTWPRGWHRASQKKGKTRVGFYLGNLLTLHPTAAAATPSTSKQKHTITGLFLLDVYGRPSPFALLWRSAGVTRRAWLLSCPPRLQMQMRLFNRRPLSRVSREPWDPVVANRYLDLGIARYFAHSTVQIGTDPKEPV